MAAKRSADAASTTPPESIESITASLYAVELGAFLAERTATVKRLRSEGNRGLAAAVGKVRKPTLAAWAINNAARSDAEAVDELIAVGERLRSAQDALLSGESPAELRAALDERRQVVRRLVDVAVARVAAEGGNGEGARDDIAATFEAASLDPEVADDVRGGRLARPARGPVGFELFGFSDAAAPASKVPSPSADEARARADRARALADEAQALADTAQQEVERRRAEVEQAEAELAQAEETVERARADLAAAEEEAERATESARRAVAHQLRVAEDDAAVEVLEP